MKPRFLPEWCSAILSLALLAGFGITSASHGSYLAAHPVFLPWVFLSCAASAGLLYLNGRGIELLFASRWLGFGILATVAAFALQAQINGAIVKWCGPSAIHQAIPSLLLGFGAALCQTLGKAAAVFCVLQWMKNRTPIRALAAGLGVGLGFAVAEILFISLQMLLGNVNLTSLAGVVERAIAGGFHIYSGGLLACAFFQRSLLLLAIVLAAHTAMDSFATAFAPQAGVWVSEGFFLILAVITWICWKVATRHFTTDSDQAQG